MGDKAAHVGLRGPLSGTADDTLSGTADDTRGQPLKTMEFGGTAVAYLPSPTPSHPTPF